MPTYRVYLMPVEIEATDELDALDRAKQALQEDFGFFIRGTEKLDSEVRP